MVYEYNLETFKDLSLSTKDVLLVPNKGLLVSRSEADIHSYLFSAPMDTVTGLDLCDSLIAQNQNAVISRFLPLPERIEAFVRFAHHHRFWWSVGVNFEEESKQIETFLKCLPIEKTDNIKINICVDVAHGDTDQLHQVYQSWKELSYVRNLMSGSIATGEAALRCIDSGCNVLRVGIGPGAACTTRLVTGVGVPQLSAVFDVYSMLYQVDASLLDEVMIIADGGINNSGDIAKYLSAGATHVMLGKMLSYTNESAGWELPDLVTAIKLKSREKVKRFRGQASKEFQIQQYGAAKNVEGASSNYFNPKYRLSDLLEELNSGLSSAVSYLGVTNTMDLNPHSVEFRRITQNGWSESNTNLP